MPDDHGDFLFDWRAVAAAAGERQLPDGDRQGRADRGKRRRSPSGPKAPSPAQMIAFPAHKRVGEIRRLAKRMLELPYEQGEDHLKQRLKRTAEAMRLRGLSEPQIRNHINGLEAAVRGELWRREFLGER